MRAEMPTFLTQAASDVVFRAITNAKERGHSQVQPLHVASVLLRDAQPGSALHNAIKDSPHRLQGSAGFQPCHALEVCLRVALDRLLRPQPERTIEPVMSNALVAALKRAQANQRRGTLEQSLQPILAVQVEIDQLIISILDDPSVSRVFGEAGFYSTIVKTNMEEAVAQASLAGPSLETSTLPRRAQVPMSSFSPSHESAAFRASVFSASSAFVTAETYNSQSHGMLLDRGRMSRVVDGQSERLPPFRGNLPRPDGDISNALSMSHSLRDMSSALQQQKRREQVRLGPSLSRPLDTSFSPVQYGPNEHIKRILDILACPSKKRNPVLVSDSDLHSVSNLVTKEFTHRLMIGDVPSHLRGVQIVDLPVTSLSVGFLSPEDIVQKLSKLRSEVDGCMPGGAIISVGDLQWLVETPESGVQTHAQLVVQELQQMMTVHDTNRIWLLASATPETFRRCQGDPGLSLENQLGLEAVVVTAYNGVATHQGRHGRFQNNVSGENSLFGQFYGKPAATLKHSSMEADFCPECSNNFLQECSVLRKDEQTMSLRSGLGSGGSGVELSVNSFFPQKRHSQLSWLVDEKAGSRAPLPIKEEQTLIPDRINDLRQKWRQKCSSYHGFVGGGITSGSSGSTRDSSSSPVSEVVSSHEGSPHALHHLLSMNLSSWVPEPWSSVKAVKAADLSPHQARLSKGVNMSNFVCSSGSRDSFAVSKCGDESGRAMPFSWTNRDESSGSAVNLKLRMLASTAGNAGTFKTDLALGALSVPSIQQSRDLKEDGQQPLPGNGRWQDPSRTDRSSSKMTPPFRRHVENVDNLCAGIGRAVPWQKEAVAAVAATVGNCRSGESRKRCSNSKSCWLMLLGPDIVGKREVAKALSKLLFNGPEQLIMISGWSGFGSRGKTPLDRLAEAVARQPFSVVLLEDVERADAVMRRSLIRAMERGMLPDSNGKDVNFSNVVVLMTCSSGANLFADENNNNINTTTNNNPVENISSLGFNEDTLLGLCPRGIRLSIDSSSVENVVRKGQVLSVVLDCKRGTDVNAPPDNCRPAESILLFGSQVFKRKSDEMRAREESSSCSQSISEKRCKKEVSSAVSPSAFPLDLNLPVEENSSAEEEPCVSEEVCQTAEPESVEQLGARVIDCARAAVSKEIFALLDGAVVFKPFNLNGLTDVVLNKLDSHLQSVITPSSRAHVEIERALLELMVSYAWQTYSRQEEFHGWVESVLLQAILGVLNDDTSSFSPNSVMKLTLTEKDEINSELAGNRCSSFAGGVELLLPEVIQIGQ